MQRTVKWFMENRKLIFFVEEQEANTVSDAVMKFVEGNPPKDGDNFEVEFGEVDGEKIVTKLVRTNKSETKETPKTETKKSEPKQETKTEESNNTNEEKRTVTTACVSYKNNGITFLEDGTTNGSEFKAGKWYTVDIDTVKSLGIKKGVKVSIVSVEQDGTKNRLITSIVPVKAEEKPTEATEPVKTETKQSEPEKQTKNSYTKSSNEVQVSIEAQASVNAANDTIATLFAGKFDANKPEDGVLLKKVIDSVAVFNFELIQKLKQ